MRPFRSWVEDYRPPEQPIDHAAFHLRRTQRGQVRAARERERVDTIKDGVKTYFAHRDAEEADRQRERASHPVLRAQLHLQRRGYRVYAAAVLKKEATGWIVGGHREPLDDAALIAFAVRKGMETDK